MTFLQLQLLLLLLLRSSNIVRSDLQNKDRRHLFQQDKKPNILIILADDVGTSDIPYWGDNIVPMENIQKLQSQGVTFMDAHASSLCAPSRYMLLSGNYPHRGSRKGGTWNFADNQNQFINNQKSIAQVLKEQFNYRTGMFGKWHLGGRVPSGGTFNNKTRPLSCCNIDWKKPMEDGPNDIGFDESYYTISGIQAAPYSFFRNGYLETNVDDIKFWGEGSHATVNDNGESIINRPGEGDPNWDSTEYNTKLVKEVDNFLENHTTSDPFFMYVGLGPVHVPHSPAKFYLDGTPIAGTFSEPHLDMLYELDLVIGSMISSVEDRGLMDNTLIIFASDNGGLVNLDHTDEFGRHFRGGKGSVWEGGHTIPMIMRYDGVLGVDQKRTGLVGLNDIYATIADFVGFDIPDGSAQDSISFADHALSEVIDSQREYFGVWHWSKHKYSQALRWGNFKYAVRYRETIEEYLFDLNTDVKEERNLLREESNIHDNLYQQMAVELRRLGACPLDVEEQFLITYGPDSGSMVTCDYFRDDPTRCQQQVLGELNCNSVCGRFREICFLHDDLDEGRSYPARVLSQEPSLSPIEQDVSVYSFHSFTTMSSKVPSTISTKAPSTISTKAPSTISTKAPSTISTKAPSTISTKAPSTISTKAPSTISTKAPSTISTKAPSTISTKAPSINPSSLPSSMPSDNPSDVPSDQPSQLPSLMPSDNPSEVPSDQPSLNPSSVPSALPSEIPSSSAPTFPPVLIKTQRVKAAYTSDLSCDASQAQIEDTVANSINLLKDAIVFTLSDNGMSIDPDNILVTSKVSCSAARNLRARNIRFLQGNLIITLDATFNTPTSTVDTVAIAAGISQTISTDNALTGLSVAYVVLEVASEERKPCDGVNCGNAGKCALSESDSTQPTCICENTFELTFNSKGKPPCICGSDTIFNADINRCLPPSTQAPSTASPTISPTSLPTKNLCVDTNSTFPLLNLDKEKGCNWITKNKKKKHIRIEKYCGLDYVESICPATCGLC